MCSKYKDKLKEAMKDKKQLIVGLIILVVAILLLLYSFSEMNKEINTKNQQVNVSKEKIVIEPENVILTFDAETEKDFIYRVFYTQMADEEFNDKNFVEHANKSGQNKYSIVLPVKKISGIRIDFGSNPGKIKIKNVYLRGAQEADLNNFKECKMYQMHDMLIKHDGTFIFSSSKENPHIIFPLSENK